MQDLKSDTTFITDPKQTFDASIKFQLKFGSDDFTIRIPKGRTITKLKSDVASYWQIAMSKLVIVQNESELTNFNQKVDTLDPTQTIYVYERFKK